MKLMTNITYPIASPVALSSHLKALMGISMSASPRKKEDNTLGDLSDANRQKLSLSSTDCGKEGQLITVEID